MAESPDKKCASLGVFFKWVVFWAASSRTRAGRARRRLLETADGRSWSPRSLRRPGAPIFCGRDAAQDLGRPPPNCRARTHPETRATRLIPARSLRVQHLRMLLRSVL